MKYILTITAKRKNAKRRVLMSFGRRAYFDSVEEAEAAAANINRKLYSVAICSARFDHVKDI